MTESIDLKMAIECQHGGAATFAHVIPVKETFAGQTIWEGEVQVFDLAGNPTAKRAYAWSEPVQNSKNRNVFAVLHVPPVDSALAAVRVSIVHRTKTQQN